MKIQINSLEALERLIGGDTELEIDIRHSVVDAFTKKHLRAIANEEHVRRMSSAISVELNDKFAEYTKSPNVYISYEWKLKPEIKTLIEAQIKYKTENIINELISESLDIEKTREHITERLQKQSAWIEEELTNIVLEKRLDRLVEIKIKEKLGL